MSSTNQIFAYGTLSFPDILSELLGRKIKGTQANIKGYKRVKIKGKVYPGIVAWKGEVSGVFYENLSSDDMALLDTFEDDFYERIDASIHLVNGDEVTAATYIVPDKNLDFIVNELWDIDNFAKKYQAKYLEMVERYRKSYLKGSLGSQNFFIKE